MCFSPAKRWKGNRSAQHLWHTAYKSHALVRADMWLSTAGEKLHFGERRRENRKGEKNGKLQSDLCGWLEPHGERTSSHHTLHGNIHEVRVRLKAWCNAPTYWEPDSWEQNLTTVCLFSTCNSTRWGQHKENHLMEDIYPNHSKAS